MNYDFFCYKAEYDRLPLLSISYYSVEIRPKNENMETFEFDEMIKKDNVEATFLSSYMSLLLFANTSHENLVRLPFYLRLE